MDGHPANLHFPASFAVSMAVWFRFWQWKVNRSHAFLLQLHPINTSHAWAYLSCPILQLDAKAQDNLGNQTRKMSEPLSAWMTVWTYCSSPVQVCHHPTVTHIWHKNHFYEVTLMWHSALFPFHLSLGNISSQVPCYCNDTICHPMSQQLRNLKPIKKL